MIVNNARKESSVSAVGDLSYFKYYLADLQSPLHAWRECQVCTPFLSDKEEVGSTQNGQPKVRWDRKVHKNYGREPFSNQQRC